MENFGEVNKKSKVSDIYIYIYKSSNQPQHFV